jgi:hypothetical protein
MAEAAPLSKLFARLFAGLLLLSAGGGLLPERFGLGAKGAPEGIDDALRKFVREAGFGTGEDVPVEDGT